MTAKKTAGSSSQRIVLAANPAAAGGKAAAAIEPISKRLVQAGYEVVVCRGNSAEELVAGLHQELSSQPRAVVAVGGDGTVNLVLNVLAPHFSIPLGVIPVGTGNDIAQSWGISADRDDALDCLLAALQGTPRLVDVAQSTHGELTRYFAAVYSAGFDAIVNERANRMRFPKGPSRYTLALLRELASLRPRRYRLSIDGSSRDVEALLIAVANGPSFGGGMQVVPDASITDGQLDVFIVHPLPIVRFLSLFPKVFSGGHVGHPAVEIVHAHEVHLDVDEVVGYADGERQGELPVTIIPVTGALSVLA
jgi:diacylglycerol kinase (ATP)